MTLKKPHKNICIMQPSQFMDAVKSAIARDDRFDIGAYYFLKDSLDFTVKRVMNSNDGQHRHVTASELLYGFRDLALQEFGPMAITMVNEWGIRQCSDIGSMVFALIEEGAFGKQDSDTPEDFVNIYPLQEELSAPFLPVSPATTNPSAV